MAIFSPLRRTFDYFPPSNCDLAVLKPGMRVLVPFGPRKMVAILLAVKNSTEIPKFKMRQAFAVLDVEPIFSTVIFDLCQFTAAYYQHSLGDVFANALPKLLRGERAVFAAARKKIIPQKIKPADADISSLKLNDYQKLAIDSIVAAEGHKTFLLEGVTGSGKTEVYLQVIAEVIKNGKQALVLVPEISLTPQTMARFEERFDALQAPIVALHSRLSDRERLVGFRAAQDGSAKIIIGTRSAIFTPLKNSGIIILDEEHDLSFKQQSGLRYSARTLAVKRGELENIPVVLGSATPSLTTLATAKNRAHCDHLLLPDRVLNATLPTFHLLDIRAERLKGGFSPKLLFALDTHLKAGNQVLVFINRRGYAPTIMCHNCSWTAGCSECDVRLVLHQNPAFLSCHHCGKEFPVPENCAECGSNNLLPIGFGTERIEVMLSKFFPGVPLTRIDRDTTRRKGELQEKLQEVHSGKCKILLGTQMLTKGHHFPDVTLVAILNADSGLFSADFQASEHLAQMIVQVAGRAGRAGKKGEVYIQTHNPDHPLLLNLVHSGYGGFAKAALAERRDAGLPPFATLALLRVEAKQKETGLVFLDSLRQAVAALALAGLEILGPIEATIKRKAGFYQAQLLFQSKERALLDAALTQVLQQIEKQKLAAGLKWSLDVDPVTLLG